LEGPLPNGERERANGGGRGENCVLQKPHQLPTSRPSAVVRTRTDGKTEKEKGEALKEGKGSLRRRKSGEEGGGEGRRVNKKENDGKRAEASGMAETTEVASDGEREAGDYYGGGGGEG